MEEPRTQTDQQAANAALAALAAAGNSFALGQLWEINHGFLRRYFWQWYSRNKPVADEHGLTVDDLDQEGFFAVQAAAKAYDPAKGTFLTLLQYYVKRQLKHALFGEHCRSISTEDGKRIAVSANPLDDCTSLDTPVGEDGSDTVLGDLQEDPAASQAFQQAEDSIYTDKLHEVLETAMAERLTEREANVLHRRYYDEQTLQAVGDDLGVSRDRVRQIEQKAIRKLSGLPSLQRWHEDVITTRAWHGTGWSAWNHSGSVQECTVEYLEKKEAERFDYYAWRDQMINEHYAVFEESGYFERHPEQRPHSEGGSHTPPGEV